jgi:two-component system, OmpR family, response regulator
MRILLIEDDEDVAQLVSAGMGESGHQVTLAATGQEGMTRALGGGFDLMIFDRQLPAGIDGADLLKDLRDREVGTPVLFLSGLGGLKDWIKGLDAGGDDYIVKPFAFTDLLNRCEALHQRAQSEAASGV